MRAAPSSSRAYGRYSGVTTEYAHEVALDSKGIRRMIATINSGSSSIKFTLFSSASGLQRTGVLCHGQIDGLGDRAMFVAVDSAGEEIAHQQLLPSANHLDALNLLLNWLEQNFANHTLVAAGHRIVHGGSKYSAPVLIDDNVLADLEALVSLAPVHLPHNLCAVTALARLHPNLPQVACFDTAFHHTQSSVVTSYAIRRSLTEAGVRRYGFHGLSYEYIASVLPGFVGSRVHGKIVVAHLGQGASMCALQDLQSIATTMGFSALDGLPMGRRCGSLDPGVLLYLMRELRMDVAAVTDLLYNESGLLGLSGVSGDMRSLVASTDPHAAEAIEIFVYRIGRELGSLAAALGGLDVLVFTGGIGEHSAMIREQVCDYARWLGVDLDPNANAAGGPCITTAASRVSAWIIPTNEELVIARHTADLIQGTATPAASCILASSSSS